MKLLNLSRVVFIGVVCFAGASIASITPSHFNDLEGHHSFLKAILTTANGDIRMVTLEGVGCRESMCSRVKARGHDDSIWLDGLASVRDISHTAGPVMATFRFKDGTERRASIMAANRVLYLQAHFGLTEKMDLGSVSRIDFE